MKKLIILLILTACGEGDGPPGSNDRGSHPNLGACHHSVMFEYGCTEYRNITDQGWAELNDGKTFCDVDSTGFNETFVVDGTCENKPKGRGSCRKTESNGMTVTDWYYYCDPNYTGWGNCSLTPSKIQAACQADGGTYIPPDEAG